MEKGVGRTVIIFVYIKRLPFWNFFSKFGECHSHSFYFSYNNKCIYKKIYTYNKITSANSNLNKQNEDFLCNIFKERQQPIPANFIKP